LSSVVVQGFLKITSFIGNNINGQHELVVSGIGLERGSVVFQVAPRGLVDELEDLLSLEWAGVPDLASINVLQGLADLGGGVEVKLGGGDVGLLAVKQLDDDVVLRLGHLSGGQVADEATVAGLGLSLGNEGEGQTVGLVRGGPLAAASAGEEEAEGLEGDGAASDGCDGGDDGGSGGSGAGAADSQKWDRKAGCGAADKLKGGDESGVAEDSQNSNEGLHDVFLK